MSAEKEDIKRLSLLLFMVAVLAFFAVLSVSQGAAKIDYRPSFRLLRRRTVDDGSDYSQYSVTSYSYGHVCRYHTVVVGSRFTGCYEESPGGRILSVFRPGPGWRELRSCSFFRPILLFIVPAAFCGAMAAAGLVYALAWKTVFVPYD